MTDDICGAECVDGTACQHPAGSCPVSSHSNTAESPGNNDQSTGGRPSKFTLGRILRCLHAAERGTTVAGCARFAGIGKRTLYDWLEQYPQFSQAFNRARARGEQELLDDVRGGDPQFLLERSYEYSKTERREVEASHEHTGEDGGPINIELNETVVETGYDE